jgi:hypothetical protein
MKRKRPATNVRLDVWTRTFGDHVDGCCTVCKDPLKILGNWDLGHRHAHALGGSDDPAHLEVVCHQCNLRQGTTRSDDTHREPQRRRYSFQRLSQCAKAASYSPQSIYYIASQLEAGVWENAPRNRSPTWPTQKQADFVASVFRGCAISPMFVNQGADGKTHVFDGSNRCFAIRNFYAGNLVAPVQTDAGETVSMRYKNAQRSELSLADYPDLQRNFDNFTVQVMRFDHMSEEEVASVALVLNLGTPMGVGDRVRLLMGTPRADYLSELNEEPYADRLSALPCFQQDGAASFYIWLTLLVRAEVECQADALHLSLPRRVYHYRKCEGWYLTVAPLPVQLRSRSDDPVRGALEALAACVPPGLKSREVLSALYVALRRHPELAAGGAVARAAESSQGVYEAALASALAAAAPQA